MFITRMEGDKSINEGLCIKCAKEMNIKPVTDLLDKMGITDEQLDAMDDQMAGLMDTFGDSFDMGGAQSMPFMQMFNMPQMGMDGEDEDAALDFYNQDEMSDEEDSQSSQTEKKMSSREKKERDREKKKYKFLSAHCENLTQKAKDGKIDRIVGRDQEIERVIQILNRRTKTTLV